MLKAPIGVLWAYELFFYEPFQGVLAQCVSSLLGGGSGAGGEKMEIMGFRHFSRICLLMIGSVNKMAFGFLSGIIRQNWNDTENISMAPAQG